MIRKVSFLILLFSFIGCGGEVHFVTPVGKLEPAIEKPQKVIETFHYRRAVGTHVIGLVFYPRKNLIDQLIPIISGSIPKFVDDFLSTPSFIDNAYFLMTTSMREAYAKDVPVRGLKYPTSPGVALDASHNVQLGLATLLTKPFPGDSVANNPLATLLGLTRTSLDLVQANSGAIWIHYVYFRDFESDPYRKTEPRYIRAQLSPLRNSLNTRPLSIFRSFVHFANLRGSSNHGKLYEKLNTDERPFPVLPLSADSEGISNDFFQTLSEELHKTSQRLILAREPELTTLEIEIAGKRFERENIRWIEKSNEIELLQSIQPTPSEGDEIKVSYEPKKSK